MSQSPADRLIKRITALHRSLELDEGGKLSTMERDLMLGYLRELYEIYATHQEGKPYSPPPTPAATPTPTAPPRQERKSPTPPPRTSTPVEPPRPAPTRPAPAPAPAPPKPTPPKPTPAPTAPPAPSKPDPKPSAPAPVYRPATPSSPELASLFEETGNAGRFGRQPLADLTKGLTINTRILFSRELFGDDNNLLNTSLQTLNSAGSFAAAKPVLESMARRFDWHIETRQETAKEFIELVRRRYV